MSNPCEHSARGCTDGACFAATMGVAKLAKVFPELRWSYERSCRSYDGPSYIGAMGRDGDPDKAYVTWYPGCGEVRGESQYGCAFNEPCVFDMYDNDHRVAIYEAINAVDDVLEVENADDPNWRRTYPNTRGPALAPADAESVVYFIRSADSGLIKIGLTTKGVGSRIAAMKTGHPGALEVLATIPGDRTTEKALHRRFATHRRSGEWFEAVTELMFYIEGLACE